VGSSNKSLFPPGLTAKAKVEGVVCVCVCVCVCELSLPASSNKVLLFPISIEPKELCLNRGVK
jgi:hypothetical protein